MPETKSDIVGVAVDYPQLRALLSARARELGLRHLEIDDMANLQGGYTSKLFCGDRHLGDLSMGRLLGALRLELAVVRSAGTYEGPALENARLGAGRLTEKIKKRSEKGGRARAMNMTPLQRSKSAKKAVRARWVKWQKLNAERQIKARKKAAVK